VYSWTITHQAPLRAFAARAPYAVLVVELDEGVHGRGLGRGDAGCCASIFRSRSFERITAEGGLPQFRPRGVP
jgi:hypothetical protein